MYLRAIPRHTPPSWLDCPNQSHLIGTMPSADIATRLASSPIAGPTGAYVAATASIAGPIAGPTGAYVAATASIAGHIVPVWSRGKGGKGVATSAGACLAVFPAYFPIDAAVAATTAVTRRNAEHAMRVSSAVWVAAAVLWWRRRLPNAWGPSPTVGLPLFALAGAAMILTKFRTARPTR